MTISERTLRKWRREALQKNLLTTDERLHELHNKILQIYTYSRSRKEREMKLHLRADHVDTFHVRFTVFMNGANCGQLCMTDEEATFFHNMILTTKYKLPEDEIYSSGKWFLEEKEEKDANRN